MNDDLVVRIASKVIKQFEGCELRSYPDSASELSIELSKQGLLRRYIDGKIELPEHLSKLSGAPWSAMYGETLGIKPGMLFTQQEADTRLDKRVRGFLQEVLAASPKLKDASAEKIAAVVSLVYNIGITQYKTSTVRKRIAAGDWQGAAEALTWFNKAQGRVMQGLVNRRTTEKNLFLSVVS